MKFELNLYEKKKTLIKKGSHDEKIESYKFSTYIKKIIFFSVLTQIFTQHRRRQF